MDTKTPSKIEEVNNTGIADVRDKTIFDILARDICSAIRFVCRKWYQMIIARKFVHTHLQQSTPVHLIQHRTSKSDGPIIVSTRKGEKETSNTNYKFMHNFFSSCNGLILKCRDKSHHNNICITNPATKRHFSIPPFVTNTTSYTLNTETESVTQFGSHLTLLIGSNMTSLSNCSHVAAQTCYPCKSNMLKSTNIESLPEDVLFEILLRVPAQDLYDSTSLVCRKWYNMIDTRNFANSHIQRLTSGLLAVDRYFNNQYFVMMQNGRIEISKWIYDFSHLVLSSCNGLVLEIHENSKGPYITNPVTKRHFALPPFIFIKEMAYNWFALVYADSSRVYKVVSISNLECAIIRVGVDIDWGRRVSTQHLSLKAKELLKESPLTTRGFVHWALDDCFECVLTMNVESEIITQIPGPCLCDDGKSLWCRYLPKGSYLYMLIGRDVISWELEVWEMKPETGEWTRMPNIELEPQKVLKHLSFKCKGIGSTSPLLKPVGWSNCGEVLFFRVCMRFHHVYSGIFVAYNISTREIDSCELDHTTLFFNHRSSLLWLD